MFDLGLFWQIIGVLGLLAIVVLWILHTPSEEWRKAGYRAGLDKAWGEAREERNNQQRAERRNAVKRATEARETVKKELLQKRILCHRLDPKKGVVVEWNLGDEQDSEYKDLI